MKISQISIKIQDFGNENVIICGDWNLVLNPDIDTENYLHINNPRARTGILKFIEEDNFIDVYRNLHDEKVHMEEIKSSE